MEIMSSRIIDNLKEDYKSSFIQSTIKLTHNKKINENKSIKNVNTKIDLLGKFDETIEKVTLMKAPLKISAKNTKLRRSRSCNANNSSKVQKSQKNFGSNQNLLDMWNTVRKSERCTDKIIKEKKEQTVIRNLIRHREEGMRIINTADKGRGVESTVPFTKDSFIVEYAGDLISEKVAVERELEYQKDSSKGSYMFHFRYCDSKYCVDATAESGRLGRLLNHSKIHPNCYVKVIPIDNIPRLTIFAKRDIEIGEELIYDYGDRDKATIDANPWLKY